MQLGGCCIKCFGADINCFIPYKEVKFSNIVLSPVFMSSTDQDFDLALKLPSDITKWGSQLAILSKSFSKLLIKESKS